MHKTDTIRFAQEVVGDCLTVFFCSHRMSPYRRAVAQARLFVADASEYWTMRKLLTFLHSAIAPDPGDLDLTADQFVAEIEATIINHAALRLDLLESSGGRPVTLSDLPEIPPSTVAYIQRHRRCTRPTE